jgi:uncharacterized protein
MKHLKPLAISLCLLLAPLSGCTPPADACSPEGLTPIAAIKGYADAAPLAHGPVRVEGTVSAVFLGEHALNGFYIQHGEGTDAVGIFVYLPRVPAREGKLIVPGNRLQLEGRSGEHRGQRQLYRLERVTLCGEGAPPPPLPVQLPLDETELARREGTLIEIAGPLTVTGTHELGRYGTLHLSTEGRRFRPTNFDPPPPQRPGLLLDDGSYRAFPQPIPYLDDDGSRRVGARIPTVVGVLAYAFDEYRLHPSQSVRFEASNPRPPALPRPGEAVRVAAFNVENYFLTLGQRGARNFRELDEQRAKLQAVAAGLHADILTLSEVENRREALLDLVETINASLPAQDHYRAVLGKADRGTDAIKLAILYRPTRVELVAGPYADADAAHDRPPLAAFFRRRGAESTFGVATMHFKSKTRCPPRGDVDTGQGCWNQRRVAQAQASADFLQRLAERYGEPLLFLGDLNSYGAEDPVALLRAAGFTDLIAERLPPEGRYTYVFRGESGYLDHALASAALRHDVESVRIWHVNADEPQFLGYRRPSNASRLYRPDAYRSSDHDPIAVDLRLQ